MYIDLICLTKLDLYSKQCSLFYIYIYVNKFKNYLLINFKNLDI